MHARVASRGELRPGQAQSECIVKSLFGSNDLSETMRRRIELVHQLLEHAVLAARRVRRAAERAVTNGRVDLG